MSSEVLLVQLTDVTMPAVSSSSSTPQSRFHTWLSKLNLPPLQSWRCVRRLRQLCQRWAPSHFIPHIPSLQRKHARARQDGHMLQAPISEVTSDLPDF